MAEAIAKGYSTVHSCTQYQQIVVMKMATTDIITGLPNKSMLFKAGERLFENNSFANYVYVMLDIKHIDPEGHKALTGHDNVGILAFAKYLDEKQIRQLERTVSGYFDYIEDLIERENTFTMEQFASSINKFLSFREYKTLDGKGRISK